MYGAGAAKADSDKRNEKCPVDASARDSKENDLGSSDSVCLRLFGSEQLKTNCVNPKP